MSDRKRARRRKPDVVAELAHMCSGRTRLVVRERKGERAFFEQLCDAVLALEGITEVEGRTLTGSLIITHPDIEGVDVITAVEAAGLLEVLPETPPRDPADEFGAWKNWLEEIVGQGSGRALSLNTITAIGFLLIALIQIQRGQQMPPAATALWYAISLLRNDAVPTDIFDAGDTAGA